MKFLILTTFLLFGVISQADYYDSPADKQALAAEAILSHDLDTLKEIVAQGIELEKVSANFYRSPLELAASVGDVEITNYLISKGLVYPEGTYEAVAAGGSVDVLKILLKHGFKLEIPTQWSEKYMTPKNHFYSTCSPLLYDAAVGGKIDLLRFLLTQNVNVNARCNSYFVSDGNHFTTPFMAVARSFTDKRNDFVRRGREKAASLLIDAGADINARSNNDGSTAWEKMANWASANLVKKLFQHGAVINAGNDLLSGKYNKEIFEDPNMMMVFIRYGKIDFKQVGKKGENLLYATVTNYMQYPSSYFEVWEQLIKNGTPTDEVFPGLSALELAHRANFPEASLKRLTELGLK